MSIDSGTKVYVKTSNSGYCGEGVVIGPAFSNMLLIKTEDSNTPIITAREIDLRILSLPDTAEPINPNKRKPRRKDIVPDEAFEGRRDLKDSPTDGKKKNKNSSKKGNGKRLPKRAHRGMPKK